MGAMGQFRDGFTGLSVHAREIAIQNGHEDPPHSPSALTGLLCAGAAKTFDAIRYNQSSVELPGFTMLEEVWADLLILVMHESNRRGLRIPDAVEAKLLRLRERAG